MDFILLKELMEQHAPSGFERDVGKVVARELEKCADETIIDGIGNIIAKRSGASEKASVVMIDAHMDEIGLMVNYVDSEGMMSFVKISRGGFEGQSFDDRILPSQRVTIHGAKGSVHGIVTIPGIPHLATPEELARLHRSAEMRIDVGVTSREEVTHMGIRTGDPVTFYGGGIQIKDDIVIGRAVHNRIGCLVMIEAMRRLKKTGHEATVYAVGSTQSLIGSHGARVAATRIKPDSALVVDATATSATDPGHVVRINCGPTIRRAETRAPSFEFVAHPKMRNMLESVATEEGIPYQSEYAENLLTDMAAITPVGRGVACCVIGIPTRNIHTPIEVCRLADAENAAKLVTAGIAKMSARFEQYWES